MNKLPFLVRSRTFWTIALMVVINVLPQARTFLPPALLDTITGALGIIAAYFKINPSQTYSTPTQIVAQANPLVTAPLTPPVPAPPKTP